MELDLTAFLREFGFEPGRVNARLVKASDGREVLQVRVELGALQMEVVGRPDGQPSVLEGLRTQRSGAPGATLSVADGAALRLELVMIQQRAVAFLAVGDAVRAHRDASLLVDGTELLVQRGLSAEREWAEGARFSVLVLRTRCAAMALIAAGRTRDAGLAIEAGLEALAVAAERIGIADGFDSLGDVIALRTMRDTLVPQLPPAQRAELEGRLRAAILAENYELAAILRDELRLMERGGG
jgi:hypothetical protein